MIEKKCRRDTESLPIIFLVEPIGAHGGMEKLDHQLAEAIQSKDYDVVWATSNNNMALSDQYKLLPVFRNIFGSTHPFLRAINYAVGWVKIIKRAFVEHKKRDVVIHQNFIILLPMELLFVLVIRFLKIPCVLSPHDIIPFGTKKIPKILPLFYKQFNSMIVNSRWSIEVLQGFGIDEKKVYYIPLGHVNIAYERSLLPKEKALEHFHIEDKYPIILFFGRIRQEKGLEYLIGALEIVIKSFPKTLLIIAGKPADVEVDHYKNLIDKLGLKENVRAYWSYIPDEDVPYYFRACDAVILPYTRVYQSGVILTAYAFKKPVIASAIGGLSEQILDGETGLLVPPKNSIALAKAIIEMVANPDLAQYMGEKGRKFSRKWDWDDIALQTIEVYENILH